MSRDEFFWDYPNEPIGDENPYYRCSVCGCSDPEINGRLEGHYSWCSWRIEKEKELGIVRVHDLYGVLIEPGTKVLVDGKEAVVERVGTIFQFRFLDGTILPWNSSLHLEIQ